MMSFASLRMSESPSVAVVGGEKRCTKYLFISRHGEREDRYTEGLGLNWISSAERPQDPCLSPPGRDSIKSQAKIMCDHINQINGKLVGVLSSPTIRCVETADLYCDKLLEHDDVNLTKIFIEEGLLEAARCFRGREPGEPRPNWNPLILSPEELAVYTGSKRIDLQYRSQLQVTHIHHDDAKNGVAEVHQHDGSCDGSKAHQDVVTSVRVELLFKKITSFLLESSIAKEDNSTLLLVTHGAVSKILSTLCNDGNPYGDDVKTSSFTAFVLEEGTWSSLFPNWIHHDVVNIASTQPPYPSDEKDI